MSILARIVIFILIIFLGGFCTGMLAGLHIKDKYKPKHLTKRYKMKG